MLSTERDVSIMCLICRMHITSTLKWLLLIRLIRSTLHNLFCASGAQATMKSRSLQEADERVFVREEGNAIFHFLRLVIGETAGHFVITFHPMLWGVVVHW